MILSRSLCCSYSFRSCVCYLLCLRRCVVFLCVLCCVVLVRGSWCIMRVSKKMKKVKGFSRMLDKLMSVSYRFFAVVAAVFMIGFAVMIAININGMGSFLSGLFAVIGFILSLTTCGIFLMINEE